VLVQPGRARTDRGAAQHCLESMEGRMPVTLSGIIASTLGTSAIGVAAQTALASLTILAGSTLGSLALSIGLSYLSQSLFRPSQPKPEDGQQSVRQPTAPRSRHYGRVKVSGPWVFAESEAGNFHKVIALGQGPVDAIEEYWVDDTRVTLDGSGNVQEQPWGANSEHSAQLRIESRLGASTETSYGNLSSTF